MNLGWLGFRLWSNNHKPTAKSVPVTTLVYYGKIRATYQHLRLLYEVKNKPTIQHLPLEIWQFVNYQIASLYALGDWQFDSYRKLSSAPKQRERELLKESFDWKCYWSDRFDWLLIEFADQISTRNPRVDFSQFTIQSPLIWQSGS